MPGFLKTLGDAFQELWRVCPWHTAEAIVSAGAYVDRPRKPGDRHATGEAFDLVEIHWKGQEPVIASLALRDSARYLAVEAVLRRHVPQVLDYWYNPDHRSHWHLDDKAGALGIQAWMRSDAVFLQAVLAHVYGYPIVIDGQVGPETNRVLEEVLGKRAELVNQPEWFDWLTAVAEKGFGLASSPRSPTPP
jgi:hypothetical protein